MKHDRLKKYNSVLKEIVWNSILLHTRELQETFWLITVNDVELASDLSYLDIFVSSIKNKETLCKELAKYAQVIKDGIKKNISLRKLPIIRFRYTVEMEFASDLLSKINLLK